MSTRFIVLSLAGYSTCVLLSGCVDPVPIERGEPDRLMARRMLMDVGAVDDRNKAKTMESYCPISLDSAPARFKCYYISKSLIDYRYEEYETALVHAGADGNLTMDVLALGLSTAGAVTPGAAGPRLFSALAAGALGIKNFVNEDVLSKNAITLVTDEMESDRATVDSKTKQNLQLPTYTMPELMNDMFAYYKAGTFEAALTALEAKASKSSSSDSPSQFAAQAVVTVKGGPFTKGTSFSLAATVGDQSVVETYQTQTKAEAASAVASGLAGKFSTTDVKAVANADTITLTYSTTGTVTWVAIPTASISVAPQTVATTTPSK